MGFLASLGAKLFGIDMDQVNGWKTYAGGAVEMLTAVAGIVGALVNIITELMKLSTAGQYVNWAVAASHGQDASVIAIGAAVALFGKGLADIGLAHKHDKLLAAVTAPQVPQPATPPTQNQTS